MQIDIEEVKNFIHGSFSKGSADPGEVISPLNGAIISKVHWSSQEDLEKAVAAARDAFPAWSSTPIKERVQVFYEYRTILEKNRALLKDVIREENGKTGEEAEAEVDKSIELTEFACSIPQIVQGEVLEVSKGVDCKVEKVPLGVVATINPFNFPLMVPHWTIPNALVLGNSMVMKPSELVPLTSTIVADMLLEAGLPKGVFNTVNGSREIVEGLCDHPEIQAISFVGSTEVAKQVYRKSTQTLKRCLALGGAKNHLLVLPDADPEMAASNIAASMSGCAGQRCMAASAMVGIGDVDLIIGKICDAAKEIIPGQNLGSVISAEAKERIERYITEAEAEGAEVLVDGRGAEVSGMENGYYVGPTVIDKVRPEMSIAKEEVFGPVLAIMRASTVDEAIDIENGSNYGNAASVFTRDGGLAKYIAERASAGMVGVNIGVPVPREPFSFGGWNESRFGTGDITGRSSIEFWTQSKKTTIKWNPEARSNWMS